MQTEGVEQTPASARPGHLSRSISLKELPLGATDVSGPAGPGDDKSYPGAPRAAVGAVVFRGREVLLVRRRDPPSAGHWAIPGGRIRLGESLQAAAEREVLEETGVRVRAGRPVFAFDTIERDAYGRVRFHYVVVDLLAEHVEGEPEGRDDAVEAGWFAPEALTGLPVNPTTLALLRSISSPRT
jgi:ADP-ribose pyrophosphatase